MFRFLIIFLATVLTAGCVGEQSPPPPLGITRIAFTEEPIESGKDLPPFLQFFETGSTAIYSYIWFENAETLTGSYKVQMSWFYPNDLRPPVARHVIEMETTQNVAQFSLHNEEGLSVGPYKAIIRAGLADGLLTASGSARLFIGMDEGSARNFLEEEAEYLRQREVHRKKAEEERKKKEAEEAMKAASGTGAVESGTGTLQSGTGEFKTATKAVQEEEQEHALPLVP